MLISAESTVNLGTVAGLIVSITSAAVCYGMMRANLDSIIKRQEKLEAEFETLDEKYVPFRHFDAISKHLEESLRRIEINVGKLTTHILKDASHRISEKNKPS